MGGGGQKLKKESWMANERTQAQHMRIVGELAKDIYPDYNTYDIATLKTVSYGNGYQVTFWNIGDRYTAEEYADHVNEFLQYTPDYVTNAGKFEGSPEISFRVLSKRTAMRLARKYNQISIWDWENEEEINTGGTGRRDRNGKPV